MRQVRLNLQRALQVLAGLLGLTQVTQHHGAVDPCHCMLRIQRSTQHKPLHGLLQLAAPVRHHAQVAQGVNVACVKAHGAPESHFGADQLAPIVMGQPKLVPAIRLTRLQPHELAQRLDGRGLMVLGLMGDGQHAPGERVIGASFDHAQGGMLHVGKPALVQQLRQQHDVGCRGMGCAVRQRRDRRGDDMLDHFVQ